MEDKARFEQSLGRHAAEIEALLSALLADNARDGEVARPERLMAAIRHGALNGGKRIRPWLLTQSAALFGVAGDAVLRAAAAVECVHCYSLIHDDLPAMDDDDLRRGQPTVHRAYDEASAILAGDSLLTYAFEIIAAPETELPAPVKTELVLGLARAAGLGGMAGGQALDLAAEAGSPGEDEIVTLQAMKTGALIRFSCEAGAIAAGAPADDRQRLSDFGSVVGLAFQLADDLLDVTSDAVTLGKAAGKDAAAGKATLVDRNGVDWARHRLDELIEQAGTLLAPYGVKADLLRQMAVFIGRRTS